MLPNICSIALALGHVVYITNLPETPQKIFVVNHGPVPGFRGYHSNYTECPKII
jgi:hypothetical protein